LPANRLTIGKKEVKPGSRGTDNILDNKIFHIESKLQELYDHQGFF